MAGSFRHPRFLRFMGSLVIGTSAVTGSAWLYHNKNRLLQAASAPAPDKSDLQNASPLGSVLASWTTNFKPTTEWDYNWDRREPSSMKKPKNAEKDENQENDLNKVVKPRATRHLILIRHGQYRMDESDDALRNLTPLGRKQAAFAGKRLAELDIPYTKMVNSTMSRAVETSNIIAEYLPNLPRKSCDLLREGLPVPPEPPLGSYRPEANFFQDGARIEAAFRKYFHRASPKQEEDSYEIIVCHANVIRYFVCRALQLPPEAWLRMSLRHASLTWFTIRPSGRVSIRSVGDAGFMPPDALTTQ